MRVYEILFWNNKPTEGNRPDPQLGPPSAPFSDDATNLAHAFTRRGLVKSFWRLNGSEEQPSGPAPPDAGTEVIPSAARPSRAWRLGKLSPSKRSARWVRIGWFRFGNVETYQATWRDLVRHSPDFGMREPNARSRR
jgi:hypothetical protein